MTEEEVREHLRKACMAAGTSKAWAAAHKVSPSYVCDVLTQGKAPGDAILKGLGLERQIIYRKREPA